jgi:hypothetical protein
MIFYIFNKYVRKIKELFVEQKNNEIKNLIRFINKKKINTLIVHGLFDSTHTHKYIHESIFKAFKYIEKNNCKKLEVFWIKDVKDDIYNKNNRKYLIFSSPHYNTDNNLPIIDNAYYILHFNKTNVFTKKNITKYNNLISSKKVVKYVEFRYKNNNKEKLNNNIFWYDKNDNSLHLPWATNLLPDEIDKKISLVKSLKKLPYTSKNSYFCGSIWKVNEKEINKWKEICKKYNITAEFVKEKNEEIHQEKVRTGYISPAIQGESHKTNENKFYIPCRIFKNISYGNIGVTNNIGVYNLFKNYLIIYDEDLEKLMVKYIKYMDSLNDNNNFKKHKNEMIKIMNHVKKNHTYLSRLENLITKLK